MNRIKELFDRKKKDVLNVYFTAGHPQLEDTSTIIQLLDEAGVDLVEVGMPYSDPLADGQTIQNSSQIALKNGMTLQKLFEQIRVLRTSSDMPIILMGYYNQMMQYGDVQFLKSAKAAGVDGLIIPDLPMDIYESEYQSIFQEMDLAISFLVTPETSDQRLRQANDLSSAFLYVVSKSSITGSSSKITDRQKAYFQHLDHLNLTTPRLIGFGIHDHETFETACEYAEGAIIGSAFIRKLEEEGTLSDKVHHFIRGIRQNDLSKH